MDMVGVTCGRLTVTSFSHKNAQGRFFWNCECMCGGRLCTSGTALRSGVTRSCGCMSREHMRGLHAKTVLVPGEVYGRLTVTSQAHTNAQGRIFWNCVCACGNTCVVAGSKLRTEGTISCGCARIGARGTHQLSKTPEYASWVTMMHRCNNPERRSYGGYGGRGIKVCKRWLSFENFYEDMAPRPSGTTLDRIDNSRGYSKRNCRWADSRTQANNRRNNVLLTHAGKTQTLAAWAKECGRAYSTLAWRRQQGWNAVEIINGRN